MLDPKILDKIYKVQSDQWDLILDTKNTMTSLIKSVEALNEVCKEVVRLAQALENITRPATTRRSPNQPK